MDKDIDVFVFIFFVMKWLLFFDLICLDLIFFLYIWNKIFEFVGILIIMYFFYSYWNIYVGEWCWCVNEVLCYVKS